MNYQNILDEIYSELSKTKREGNLANYIPELAKINPNKYGIFLCSIDGSEFCIGDSLERFSIQSISKVFTLTMAFALEGENLWDRMDVEPSGNPFNSLIQLEYEKGIPRNPFINAGALVVCDILISKLKNPKKEYLEFLNMLVGSSKEEISYNTKVAESEKKMGFRNAALINLMKSFKNINNEVDLVLDFYYHTCSVEMSCKELAQSFLLFTNHGEHTVSKNQIITASQSKRISAIMLTCGFYDEAGEFSFRVGLPGKSGVGGGIVAHYPGEYSVACWSPILNKAGNSALGMHSLEMLTTKTGLSIF